MSKYVDIPAIMQLIGGIYLDINLLDNDEYFFCEEDFTEEFHRILFGSMFNIHALGAHSIDIKTIEDYLEQRPSSFAIYKTNKGREYLQKLEENVQLATFQYYYNRVKKMTLMRMYNNIGMDLSWLYDPDNILNIKKKQAQEDWLDNTSLEEIAEIIDKKLFDIRVKYVDNAGDNAESAGEGVLELLENLKKTPEIGYPLYGPLINTITRGARLKKLYLRSAATGVGKALPNSVIIPTPLGDKAVGDVKKGDMLFDAFGKPTKVLEIFPQGVHKVWEITFKDGRKALCNKDHLWSYCTEGQRIESKKARKFKTNTLEEISKLPLIKNGHGNNILIPMQKAVEYTEKDFYLKPYSFGLLLGDGSFRYSNQQKALTFSSEDEILPSYIAEEMHWNYKSYTDKNYSWVFEWTNNNYHKNAWVEEAFKDYNNLWNLKSNDKFIPKEYLEGSIKQRFDLLNGLLDSDGSVDSKGKISYYTNSILLRDDVIKLGQSLGFKMTYCKDSHKDTSIVYKIEISGTPEDKVKLFKLPKKKKIIEEWFNNGKRKEHNLFNPIVQIKELDYKEEMTCFLVDNEEHLFLMNDYIVTHNTRSMIADACSIAVDELFDSNKGQWVSNGTAEPTLFITTEQERDEIQTMLIAFISDVDEEHLLTGEYQPGEWERVLKAAEILKRAPLYIQMLPDFSLKDIENTIKRGIREYDVKYVFLDYLHTSMKILEEVTKRSGGVRLREDNILFMIAIRLKDLCNQYGVFIMTATQLNGDYVSAKQYDQNLLRGAKAIADKIDMGAVLLETNQDDIIALDKIIKEGHFEEPTVKLSIYKNRRGRYKNILLWCKANRGTCKIIPMFATDYQYRFIPIDDVVINVQRESAF